MILKTKRLILRPKFGLGVSLAIFNSNLSKILLLKRNEAKRKKWGVDWGNIGGGIEPREFSLDAAIREAREETCLNIDKSRVKLMEIKELPDFTKEHHGIHFAYAASIDENTPLKINQESDCFCWFNIDELPDRMFDSKETILKWKNKFLNINP